jgi:phosphate/sulfate permease
VSFATWKSLPVSMTHSIVGAMIGFGIMAGGFSVINWGKLFAVILSWIISPVFALVIGFVMFKVITRLILSKKDPFTWSLKLSPLFIGIACVLGVGLARGLEAVNFRIIFQIIIYWVLTVPAAAITSIVIFKILKFFL